MNRTFFHCTSSRSASSARRSISDACRAISGRSSVELLDAVGVDVAVPDVAQQPMHDEVRIAPDRRREVRVVVGGARPKCPRFVRRVPRLLHGAQHQEGNRPLLGRAMNPLEQPLEVPRSNGARAARARE